MNMFATRKMTRIDAQREKGFTLIEVMIVVAVVGILLAIGVPAYQQFIVKSKRVEATSLLMEAAGEQQRFYTENNRFATDMTEMGYANAQVNSETGLYTVSVTASTRSSYTLTAAPVATESQARDADCGSFTINSGGLKGIVGGTETAEDCW